MFKHILGQAFVQLIILVVVTLTGDTWIPEYKDYYDNLIASKIAASDTLTVQSGKIPWSYDFKYNSSKFVLGDESTYYVRSGRHFQISSQGEDYYKNLTETITPSRHFTFVFNFFVMMQLVNFFNSRMLKDEFNIFKNIFKSGWFMIIVFTILVL